MMDEDNDSSFTPHVLTEQEIMHKYWRISMNVRLASVALQRWMSSIIGLITTWSAIRMVFWLSHTPSWYGVFMFIIPLLLLPLLATSYAEVNYEGEKVIQVSLVRERKNTNFELFLISVHSADREESLHVPVFVRTSHQDDCIRPRDILWNYRLVCYKYHYSFKTKSDY